MAKTQTKNRRTELIARGAEQDTTMHKKTIYVEVAMDVESNSPLPPESDLDDAVVDAVTHSLRDSYMNGFTHDLVNTSVTPAAIGVSRKCNLRVIKL
jgi:hypothetical protein